MQDEGHASFHSLPWPTAALRDLGAAEVRRSERPSVISSSPAPGEAGWRNRYRYQSHGLRFEMKRPGELLKVFKDRISKAVEEEDDEDDGVAVAPLVRPRIAGDNWILGPNARNRGSIHSDVWRGD